MFDLELDDLLIGECVGDPGPDPDATWLIIGVIAVLTVIILVRFVL